jgi:4-hydroxy-tetrahydrodipicolinate reductase
MKFAIAGASGRMGRMLIEAVLASPGDSLAGALDQPGSAALGQDAAAFLGRPCGVAITADLATGLAGADVLVDFTRPEGTLGHLAACRARGLRLVIGTTGFDAAGKAAIAAAAREIPLVFAANMSVGVNVTIKLLEMAAKALAADYDIEIVEAHHKHKVDAPSGTALAMGEAIAAA